MPFYLKTERASGSAGADEHAARRREYLSAVQTHHNHSSSTHLLDVGVWNVPVGAHLPHMRTNFSTFLKKTWIMYNLLITATAAAAVSSCSKNRGIHAVEVKIHAHLLVQENATSG